MSKCCVLTYNIEYMQFLQRNNVAESSLVISGGSEPTKGRIVTISISAVQDHY